MPNDFLGYKLEDWLPQEVRQGPPLPEWMKIYWPWYKPPVAAFKVSNLVISPSEVQIGYPVNISCLVENIGTETGARTIICNVEGEIMAEKQITLNPGETMTVSFQVVPDVAKTYSVTVDGLHGSFVATKVPAADIRVENLVISPTECRVGETVTISVTATNYGTATGTKQIICTVT